MGFSFLKGSGGILDHCYDALSFKQLRKQQFQHGKISWKLYDTTKKNCYPVLKYIHPNAFTKKTNQQYLKDMFVSAKEIFQVYL